MWPVRMVAPIFTFERNIRLIKGLIDGREREENKEREGERVYSGEEEEEEDLFKEAA